MEPNSKKFSPMGQVFFARLVSGFLILSLALTPSADAASPEPFDFAQDRLRRRTLRPTTERKVEAGLEEALRGRPAAGEEEAAGWDRGALLKVMEDYVAARDEKAVGEAFLEAVQRILGYDLAALYLVDPPGRAGEPYRIRNEFRSGGFEAASQAAAFVPASFEKQWALEAPSPQGDLYIANRWKELEGAGRGRIDADALKRNAAAYGGRDKVRSVYYVVLKDEQGKPWGLILAANWLTGRALFPGRAEPEREQYREEVRRVLETLGSGALFALENARAYQRSWNYRGLATSATHLFAGPLHDLKNSINNLTVVAQTLSTEHVALSMLSTEINELSFALAREATGTLETARKRIKGPPPVPRAPPYEALADFDRLFHDVSLDLLEAVRRGRPEAIRPLVNRHEKEFLGEGGYPEDRRQEVLDLLDKWTLLASSAIASLQEIEQENQNLLPRLKRLVERFGEFRIYSEKIQRVLAEEGERLEPDAKEDAQALVQRIDRVLADVNTFIERVHEGLGLPVEAATADGSEQRNLRLLLYEGIQSVRERFKRPDRIEWNFAGLAPDQAVVISTEEARIVRRAMGELLENAWKYRRGGSVPLKAAVRAVYDPKTAMLRLSVEDNGIGIPEAVSGVSREELLFKPGERMEGRQGMEGTKGTGLGLGPLRAQFQEIRKRLSDAEREAGKDAGIRLVQSKGIAEVKPGENSGSTFEFWLPLTPEPPAAAAAQPAAPSTGSSDADKQAFFAKLAEGLDIPVEELMRDFQPPAAGAEEGPMAPEAEVEFLKSKIGFRPRKGWTVQPQLDVSFVTVRGLKAGQRSLHLGSGPSALPLLDALIGLDVLAVDMDLQAKEMLEAVAAHASGREPSLPARIQQAGGRFQYEIADVAGLPPEKRPAPSSVHHVVAIDLFSGLEADWDPEKANRVMALIAETVAPGGTVLISGGSPLAALNGADLLKKALQEREITFQAENVSKRLPKEATHSTDLWLFTRIAKPASVLPPPPSAGAEEGVRRVEYDPRKARMVFGWPAVSGERPFSAGIPRLVRHLIRENPDLERQPDGLEREMEERLAALQGRLEAERSAIHETLTGMPGRPWEAAESEDWLKNVTIRIHGTSFMLIFSGGSRLQRPEGGHVTAFRLSDGRDVFLVSESVAGRFEETIRNVFPEAVIWKVPPGWFTWRAIRGKELTVPGEHIDGVINAVPRQANKDGVPVLLVDPVYGERVSRRSGGAPWRDLQERGLLKVVEVDPAERHLNPANFAVLLDHHILINQAPGTVQRLIAAGVRPDFIHVLKEPLLDTALFGGSIGCLLGIEMTPGRPPAAGAEEGPMAPEEGAPHGGAFQPTGWNAGVEQVVEAVKAGQRGAILRLQDHDLGNAREFLDFVDEVIRRGVPAGKILVLTEVQPSANTLLPALQPLGIRDLVLGVFESGQAYPLLQRYFGVGGRVPIGLKALLPHAAQASAIDQMYRSLYPAWMKLADRARQGTATTSSSLNLISKGLSDRGVGQIWEDGTAASWFLTFFSAVYGNIMRDVYVRGDEARAVQGTQIHLDTMEWSAQEREAAAAAQMGRVLADPGSEGCLIIAAFGSMHDAIASLAQPGGVPFAVSRSEVSSGIDSDLFLELGRRRAQEGRLGRPFLPSEVPVARRFPIHGRLLELWTKLPRRGLFGETRIALSGIKEILNNLQDQQVADLKRTVFEATSRASWPVAGIQTEGEINLSQSFLVYAWLNSRNLVAPAFRQLLPPDVASMDENDWGEVYQRYKSAAGAEEPEGAVRWSPEAQKVVETYRANPAGGGYLLIRSNHGPGDTRAVLGLFDELIRQGIPADKIVAFTEAGPPASDQINAWVAKRLPGFSMGTLKSILSMPNLHALLSGLAAQMNSAKRPPPIPIEQILSPPEHRTFQEMYNALASFYQEKWEGARQDDPKVGYVDALSRGLAERGIAQEFEQTSLPAWFLHLLAEWRMKQALEAFYGGGQWENAVRLLQENLDVMEWAGWERNHAMARQWGMMGRRYPGHLKVGVVGGMHGPLAEMVDYGESPHAAEPFHVDYVAEGDPIMEMSLERRMAGRTGASFDKGESSRALKFGIQHELQGLLLAHNPETPTWKLFRALRQAMLGIPDDRAGELNEALHRLTLWWQQPGSNLAWFHPAVSFSRGCFAYAWLNERGLVPEAFKQSLPADWSNLKTAEWYPFFLGKLKAKQGAGLEEEAADALRERMPSWLQAVMSPEELFESVRRAHDPAAMTDRVAVLVQPELLPPGWRPRDSFDPPLELWGLAGNLQGIYGWPDQVSVRVDPWSEEAEVFFRERGYRIVRIIRDEADRTQEPISREWMLLILAQAAASGQPLFPVNVPVYRLRMQEFSIDAEEVRETLTRLCA